MEREGVGKKEEDRVITETQRWPDGRKQAGQINSEVVQFSSKKKVIRDAGSGNAARENELDSHLTMNNVCQRNCGEFWNKFN